MPIYDEHGIVTAEAPFKEAKLETGKVILPYPFKMSIVSVDNTNKTLKFSINPLSFIYSSPYGRNLVTVFGIGADAEAELKEVGDFKLSLDIFYERSRMPAFGVIHATVDDENFEMIQKTEVGKAQEAARKIVNDSEGFRASMGKFTAGLSTFFEGANKSNWKKQFRSRVPLASLVSPSDLNRDGDSVSIHSNESPSQISQQLNTNLVLIDSLYEGIYPIKVPIPFGVNTSD